MTARQIINDIANSKEYRQICNTITSNSKEYSKDLFQELILMLCEHDPGKLEAMHEKGVLKWFVIRVLKNQYQSNTSGFYKKHRDFRDRSTDLSAGDVAEDQGDSEEIESMLNFINNEMGDSLSPNLETWYKRTVFNEMVNSNSIRSLARKTGIPRTSLADTVNNYKKELLNKYNTMKKKDLPAISDEGMIKETQPVQLSPLASKYSKLKIVPLIDYDNKSSKIWGIKITNGKLAAYASNGDKFYRTGDYREAIKEVARLKKVFSQLPQ